MPEINRPKSYIWGLNERYYVDSEGNIEETDGESPPQTGTIPKFVATELLRLVNSRNQPVINIEGVERYKENSIVRFLLDNSQYDLNKLALLPFTIDDRKQFAQLIGYSVCGFNDLFSEDK